MKLVTTIAAYLVVLLLVCEGFVVDQKKSIEVIDGPRSRYFRSDISKYSSQDQHQEPNNDDHTLLDPTRRSLLATTTSTTAAALSCLLVSSSVSVEPVVAAVGSLPELADTNAILQGLTIQVADKSQQDAMINFLAGAFGFTVLRKRVRGSIEETWLGFGPEQLNIPSKFVMAVSSFAEYGGHASIHMVYDSALKEPLYRVGSKSAPGNNIAFLQVAVPSYRISQILSSGGVIQDAYGLVDVISPSGLPVRGIVGIWPDPMMLLAINCVNVAASAEFYERLGFVKRDMPYSRPSLGTTMFEPAPPKGSVYLSPSANGMGILLLPTKKKALTPNRVVDALNIVYTPSEDAAPEASTDSIVDPSGVSISFQSVQQFEVEEKETR